MDYAGVPGLAYGCLGERVMTERTELGRIQRAEFGMGGYQDVQIGISLTLGGKSWGVADFWGHWSTKPVTVSEWTDADRITSLGSTVMLIAKLLSEAKKTSVSDLVGVPVEVTFERGSLKSWRILEEVL